MKRSPRITRLWNSQSTGMGALLSIICFFLIGNNTSYSQGLFEDEEIIELTLGGDLKTLLKDRGDDPQYHLMTLSYQSESGIDDIAINVKTRGNFRKMARNCKYPPLFLNFKDSKVKEGTLFEAQEKTKLVTPCQRDEYNIHEYLVYKLYNLITPKSFRARLVKVVYEDSEKGKASDPLFSVLLEEEDQMAARNHSFAIEKMGVRPEATQREYFLKMAVFEYMIGNTDWSVQYMQNVKFITEDSSDLPISVPYDFDHAGIVRAPYAKPAEALQMTSTLERRYRGYCITDMNEFTPIFETFNQLKDKFYALYEGNPLLSSSYQKQTIKFLDQFYETINDPEKAEKAFSYPCDKYGTGNVVIQGLKKN